MAPSSTVVLQAVEHRQELTGYCSRMLGSGFDADDAVQETMVRAWTRGESFEGRSSVHSWLYRIATNVCLDMLRSRRRRAVPMDLTGWEPAPDGRRPAGDDPAEAAATREMVEVAFVVALQQLPARQRAVLVLREVLQWSAPEVAELLGTSVASVNSALQRARATLAARTSVPEASTAGLGDGGRPAYLTRQVAAFERYDMPSLVALLRGEVQEEVSRSQKRVMRALWDRKAVRVEPVRPWGRRRRPGSPGRSFPGTRCRWGTRPPPVPTRWRVRRR